MRVRAEAGWFCWLPFIFRQALKTRKAKIKKRERQNGLLQSSLVTTESNRGNWWISLIVKSGSCLDQGRNAVQEILSLWLDIRELHKNLTVFVVSSALLQRFGCPLWRSWFWWLRWHCYRTWGRLMVMLQEALKNTTRRDWPAWTTGRRLVVWGPVVQWLVQRFQSERMRVRSYPDDRRLSHRRPM